MAERRIGIIMNGITGRMGMNQHLIRSIAAIRAEGGLALADGDRLMPDPIIVGRSRAKLDALARAHRIERVSTDLDACLADHKDEIFFDAATTQMRAGLIRKAIAAGKHVYCEKPTADNLADALDIARLARQAQELLNPAAGGGGTLVCDMLGHVVLLIWMGGSAYQGIAQRPMVICEELQASAQTAPRAGGTTPMPPPRPPSGQGRRSGRRPPDAGWADRNFRWHKERCG